MDKFNHDLPDLYLPVINKLWFRFMNLWLTATELEIEEQEEMKDQEIKLADRMVIDKDRLIQQMWKLLNKFKTKCLSFMLSKKVKDIWLEYDKNNIVDGGQKESALEYNNNSDDKKSTGQMFRRVDNIFKRQKTTQGLTISMQVLIQSCLVEFFLKGDVQRSHLSIFRFFTEVDFLDREWSVVKLYLGILRKELKYVVTGKNEFKINMKDFSTVMGKVISLVEDIYVAYFQFKLNKPKANIFLKAWYGNIVIEKMTEAKLYQQLVDFKNREFGKVLKELKWHVEIAQLDLHIYNLLLQLIKDGTIYLGNKKISANLLGTILLDIVDKLKEVRMFDMALEILELVKWHYQKIYDFESMALPLDREVEIYQLMSKHARENHATYFKIKFFGQGHLEEFRDSTFILRTKANKTILETEEKLRKRFDPDLKYIEDEWPTEDEILNGDRKFCHIVKVLPLTFNEVKLYDLYDMFDNEKNMQFDDEDRILQEKTADMPQKLANYHLQNFKDKFYSTNVVYMAGVDSLLLDQHLEVYGVKKKFPNFNGMQKIIAQKSKTISCVRKAIKDIEETNQHLREVKENVQQSAVDKYNVELLYTALRKTLIAEINGGFKRYITNFFTEESMLIPGREELLH